MLANLREIFAFAVITFFAAFAVRPSYAQAGDVRGVVTEPNGAGRLDNFSGHPRIFVVSDIGNEPDDQMSFVRLLLYSNEIDVEGLVAATSTWQKAVTHPETMHQIIAVYGQVQPNLLKHAAGWPTAVELDQKVSSGQSSYGMSAVGIGKTSSGSQLLVKAADRDDPRPL